MMMTNYWCLECTSVWTGQDYHPCGDCGSNNVRNQAALCRMILDQLGIPAFLQHKLINSLHYEDAILGNIPGVSLEVLVITPQSAFAPKDSK